ncbi:MFS transporter [Pelagibacterium nitratireducens]|uniref:MFS transporter n=1 Tax=Pelagibacterium nitratireducens TaxID=1046114 RepID=A0ABZ2I033_9HYPH
MRLFVLGNFLSNTGTWAQRIAVGWLTFELTGSASWVGVVAACEVVPSFIVQPLGGVLVDRTHKWKLLVLGQGLAALQALALTFGAALEMLSLPFLLCCALVLGLLEGINQPSRLSMVGDLAPNSLLRPTIALNSFANNTARFAGPMVGGAALGFSGPTLAFALNAASFIPLLMVVLGMRRLPMVSAASTAQTSLLGGIPEGLSYIRHHPLFSVVLAMALALSLCSRSVIELLPAISGLWFDGRSEILAAMTTSVGLGAMAGGIWMLSRSDLDAVLLAVLTLPGLMVLSIFALSFAGIYVWASYALLAVLGFCAVGSGVGMQSIIHLNVDTEFRGRVLSVYGLIQRGIAALGAVLIGVSADHFGMRPSLVAACSLAMVAWVLAWRKRQTLASYLRAEL